MALCREAAMAAVNRVLLEMRPLAQTPPDCPEQPSGSPEQMEAVTDEVVRTEQVRLAPFSPHVLGQTLVALRDDVLSFRRENFSSSLAY